MIKKYRKFWNSVHCIFSIDLIFFLYIGSSISDERVNYQPAVTHNLCLASEEAVKEGLWRRRDVITTSL